MPFYDLLLIKFMPSYFEGNFKVHTGGSRCHEYGQGFVGPHSGLCAIIINPNFLWSDDFDFLIHGLLSMIVNHCYSHSFMGSLFVYDFFKKLL